MIVDIYNKGNELEISYINSDGLVDILTKRVEPYRYNVVEYKTDQLDWKGQYADKNHSKSLGNHEIRQTLHALPQEEKNKIFAYNIPIVYACDIEIDIRGKMGKKLDIIIEDACCPVNLITITTDSLDTIVLALEDDIRTHETTGVIYDKIQKKIFNHISESNDSTKIMLRDMGIDEDNPPKVKIYWYSTERKLLEAFFKAQNKSLHCSIWWNSETFDSRYLHNRALVVENEHFFTNKNSDLSPQNQAKEIKRNGRLNNPTLKDIHIRNLASPTKRFESRGSILTDGMSAKFGDEKPKTTKPLHRLELDYMVLTEKYTRRDSKSLKLDVVAEEKLGFGKVSYSGNFEKLIKGDTETFIFYGCIDTVSLMLIHLQTKALNMLCIGSFDAKVRIEDAFFVSRTSAAVFSDYFWLEKGLVSCGRNRKSDEMDDADDDVKSGTISKIVKQVGHHFTTNLMNLDGTFQNVFSRSVRPPKKKKARFEGAYVVSPRGNKIGFSAFLDAKSLYPSSGMSLKPSSEIYIKTCKTNQEVQEELAKGNRISFNRHVYDGSRKGALATIWERQIEGRYNSKDLSINVENYYISAIEQAINELETNK
jgi:hypothetical protein